MLIKLMESPDDITKLMIEKDLDELQKRTGIIIDKNPIGKGGFALVYSGTKEKRKIAIKVICIKGTKSEPNTRNINWAKTDLLVTGNLKNKSCIRCLGLFEFPNTKMILLDYASNKDMSFLTHMFYSQELFKGINIKQFKPAKSPFEKEFNEKYKWYFYMSESFIRFFFHQILNALIYLRKMNFVHCDLKLENLLLVKNFQVKLTDFAMSACIPSAGLYEPSSAGTSLYMPIECLDAEKKEVTTKDAYKIDYYALGVILHKMLYNEFVVNSKDKENRTVNYKELTAKLDFISFKLLDYACEQQRGRKFTSDEVQRLLVSLLDKDIVKRADLNNIITHPWTDSKQEVIKHLQDVYEIDQIKFLLELQKIDCIPYYSNKDKIIMESVQEINVLRDVDCSQYIHIKFNKLEKNEINMYKNKKKLKRFKRF